MTFNLHHEFGIETCYCEHNNKTSGDKNIGNSPLAEQILASSKTQAHVVCQLI